MICVAEELTKFNLREQCKCKSECLRFNTVQKRLCVCKLPGFPPCKAGVVGSLRFVNSSNLTAQRGCSGITMVVPYNLHYSKLHILNKCVCNIILIPPMSR